MSLITVQRYANAALAHIDKGLLDAEGIPAVIDFENSGSIPEIMGDFLGGIRLRVEEKNYAAAKQLLKIDIC